MNFLSKAVALRPFCFKIVKKQMRLQNLLINFFKLETSFFFYKLFDSFSIQFQNIIEQTMGKISFNEIRNWCKWTILDDQDEISQNWTILVLFYMILHSNMRIVTGTAGIPEEQLDQSKEPTGQLSLGTCRENVYLQSVLPQHLVSVEHL